MRQAAGTCFVLCREYTPEVCPAPLIIAAATLSLVLQHLLPPDKLKRESYAICSQAMELHRHRWM